MKPYHLLIVHAYKIYGQKSSVSVLFLNNYIQANKTKLKQILEWSRALLVNILYCYIWVLFQLFRSVSQRVCIKFSICCNYLFDAFDRGQSSTEMVQFDRRISRIFHRQIGFLLALWYWFSSDVSCTAAPGIIYIWWQK